MAYLDWSKSSEITLSHEWQGDRVHLKLATPLTMIGAVRDALVPVLSAQDRELRVELPRKWVLFVKLREGSSRLLVAHPEQDVLVSTLALTLELAERMAQEIQKVGVFKLGFEGEADSVSNLRLEWEVR